VDLARGVVYVVVAANHVGDLHVDVVDHHAEVVGGCTVGACNDEVVELGVVEGDGALDHVIPGRDAFRRVAKPHHRLSAFRNGRQGFAGFGAPGAVIAGLQAGGTGLFAHDFHFFGRTVAIIGGAFFQHACHHFAVAVHALHLVERTFIGR